MNARTTITRCPGERAAGARCGRGSLRSAAHRAFSLIELLVVITVVILLTALMMPAMQQLHENAQRVVCMANLQQMGHAFFMYGGDHNDALPTSESLIHGDGPQDLMVARRETEMLHDGGWDGIGKLFELHYCDAAQCFYCPSHHGSHPYERYAAQWGDEAPSEPIYTNYHYAGHITWNTTENYRKRSLDDGYELVLATDGLRTAEDFNHVLGMNVVRGDGSVQWREDTDSILKMLPRTANEQVSSEYINLWELVERAK